MSKLEPVHVSGAGKRQHAAAGWRAHPPAPWMMLALIGWCSAWQNGVIQSTLSFAAGPKHCNLQQAACLPACLPACGGGGLGSHWHSLADMTLVVGGGCSALRNGGVPVRDVAGHDGGPALLAAVAQICGARACSGGAHRR